MDPRLFQLLLTVGLTILIASIIGGITYAVLKSRKSKTSGEKEEEDKKNNTTSNFGSADYNELILCHAGYCGYCKDFLPKFQEAVPILRAKYRGLKITTYQHETQLEMIRNIQPPVEYYPTMRLNGQEFEGPRTAEGVVEFVDKFINLK